MNVYWYAPFDNAGELAMAGELAAMLPGRLTVQSCASRFGVPLVDSPGLGYRMVRNLPEPAGEAGGRRTVFDRWEVAARRSRLRGRLLGEVRPDVVHLHTHNPFTDWYASRSIAGRYPRFVQSVHNVRPHAQVRPRWLETRLLKASYSEIPHLVVAHELLRQSLIDEFAVRPDGVTVVPLPMSPFVGGARGRGVEAGRLRLLFFGTLRANKGLGVLLAAMRRLPPDLAVSLTIAGRGEAGLELMAREAARADGRIRAEVGFVTAARKRELFLEADLVVLPYDELNAQSGVLGDAYGYGLPLIVSDVPTISAAVVEDGSGWVFPRGDAAALAAMIERVSAEPGARARSGAAGLGVATARSPRNIASMLLELYGAISAGDA